MAKAKVHHAPHHAPKAGGMSKEIEEGKAFAFLGVFLGIIGFLIVLLTKKENKYAMYYAKQGLILTIAWAIVWVITMVLVFIPFLGWAIIWLCDLALIVLWIIGWLNALSGKEKPIPFIGQFAEHFKI